MDSRLHAVQMPPVGALGLIGGQAVEIRRFNDAALQTQIDKALANVPTNSAVLDVRFHPQDGLRAVAAAKLGGHWSIAVIGDYKDRQDWAGAARVSFSW